MKGFSHMIKSKRILEPEVMESLEEVYAYDKLSEQFMAILHNGFVETVINQSPPSGHFLEVGSGTGRISIGIAKYTTGIQITGIDLSENMLHVAKANCEKQNLSHKVHFQKGSATEIPFADNTFDSVFCHNMLHHIPNPETMIAEMKRVVKNEGGIFIRDLIRVSPLMIPLHVHVLGFRYNSLMKKEYRDSISAALSKREWKTLFKKASITRSKITYHFITHQGIEKTAADKRKHYVEIPAKIPINFFKKMYVSNGNSR